jgi:hypothetical protein
MGLDLSHFVPTENASDDKVLDYFTVDELNVFQGYVERHNQFIIEKDFDELGKDNVMYFESKGYQRKGMSGKFYSDFGNDKLYFDLQSVIKAYQYLEADHISKLAELQDNFQKNFIDNFVEGESIFHISW